MLYARGVPPKYELPTSMDIQHPQPLRRPARTQRLSLLNFPLTLYYSINLIFWHTKNKIEVFNFEKRAYPVVVHSQRVL